MSEKVRYSVQVFFDKPLRETEKTAIMVAIDAAIEAVVAVAGGSIAIITNDEG